MSKVHREKKVETWFFKVQNWAKTHLTITSNERKRGKETGWIFAPEPNSLDQLLYTLYVVLMLCGKIICVCLHVRVCVM